MDKYELNLTIGEIDTLVRKGQYKEAAEVADTVDWRKVKNVRVLCTVSDVYKINRRYEDSKRVLEIAYAKNPRGRQIIFSLCELELKLNNYVRALQLYNSYVNVAPRDPDRFVLQYKLYKAQDVNVNERIAVLEDLSKEDYREKWAYELARLYKEAGERTLCIAQCDELIAFFQTGRYVVRALELKASMTELSSSQKALYRKLTGEREDVPSQDVSASEAGREAAALEAAGSAGAQADPERQAVQSAPTRVMGKKKEASTDGDSISDIEGFAANGMQDFDAGSGQSPAPAQGASQEDMIPALNREPVPEEIPWEYEDYTPAKGTAGSGMSGREAGQSIVPEWEEPATNADDAEGAVRGADEPGTAERGADEKENSGYNIKLAIDFIDGDSVQQSAGAQRQPEAGRQPEAEEQSETERRPEPEERAEAEEAGEPSFDDGSFQVSSVEDVMFTEEHMRDTIMRGLRDLDNYDPYLTQETDGQYAMVMEEEQRDDDQIEGQLSLQEIMSEWEKVKRDFYESNGLASGRSSNRSSKGKETERSGKKKRSTKSWDPDQVHDALQIRDDDAGGVEYDTSLFVTEDGGAFPAEFAVEGKAKGPAAVQENGTRIITDQSYLHSEDSIRQLSSALERIVLDGSEGNVIITGDEGVGTLGLAREMIRRYRRKNPNFVGQIAKTEGRYMTRENVLRAIPRIPFGALIVERAANMSEEGAAALCEILEIKERNVLIILIDRKGVMDAFLSDHQRLRAMFPARVDIAALGIDTLLGYAREYAGKQQCEIDEYGISALESRVRSMQTVEHSVTLEDIRDIVDEAIYYASRKSISNLVDTFSRRRGGSGTRLVLRDRDFLHY